MAPSLNLLHHKGTRRHNHYSDRHAGNARIRAKTGMEELTLRLSTVCGVSAFVLASSCRLRAGSTGPVQPRLATGPVEARLARSTGPVAARLRITFLNKTIGELGIAQTEFPVPGIPWIPRFSAKALWHAPPEQGKGV